MLGIYNYQERTGKTIHLWNIHKLLKIPNLGR